MLELNIYLKMSQIPSKISKMVSKLNIHIRLSLELEILGASFSISIVRFNRR